MELSTEKLEIKNTEGVNQVTYKDFCEIINKHSDFIWIHEEKMDVGGGKITVSDIDKLENYENIDKIMISGLRQDTFEYFITKYGNRIKYLKLFKNKLVEDLSSLSSLENIIYIDFFHNQRVTQLWNMSRNINLQALAIDDFSRLHTLIGVETAPSLKYLHFGDKVWSTSTLTDLKPLINSGLIGFSFAGKSIENNDIMIFSKIPTLKYVDFPSNMFTTEDIAKLVAKCPYLEGYSLKPCITFDRDDTSLKDVLICGKRKPFLFSVADAVKIEKYVTEFNNLVAFYKKQQS
jgi:hypothetical protein